MQFDSAQGRYPDESARQRRSAHGRRIHRGRRYQRRPEICRDVRAAIDRPPESSDRGALDGEKPQANKNRRQRNPPAPAFILHGLPGAPDFFRDEISRTRTRPASRELPISAAICFQSCRRSTSAPPQWVTDSVGQAPPRSTPKKPTSAPSASWAMAVSGTTGSPAASATRSSIKATACSWWSTTATQPPPVARIFCRPPQAIRFERQNSRSRTRCAASA